MNPLSILVVDDHEEIRSLLRQWLESSKHRVECAGSGNEALKRVKDHRFDLVITDVLMPDGSGVDLIAELRKARTKVRILAISGGGPHMTSPSCLQFAQGAGAHALLLKPFRQEQLLSAIQHVLEVDLKPSDTIRALNAPWPALS